MSDLTLKSTNELDEKLSSIEYIKNEEEYKGKAQQLNIPYINLKQFPIDKNSVAIIDKSSAIKGQIVAIAKTGQLLTVCTSNPDNIETKQIIKELEDRGFNIKLLLCSPYSLNFAYKIYDDLPKAVKDLEGILTLSDDLLNSTADENEKTGASTTILIDTIVSKALVKKASDIHIEPEEKQTNIRYRLDGVLQPILTLNQTQYNNLLSRIKVISGLKLNIHAVPQDGRFTIRTRVKDIETRVSILPGAYGEYIVIRILDPGSIQRKLAELGMHEWVLNKMNSLLQKTTGAILTTGPTGSGKTTTLYACINELNEPGSKIITIEDPIEYHINGIAQTQIDDRAGYTFASGLRSILRQDPDIVLVGEIRDQETAEIAMQAALTGHLVFSTLHTNDAAGAIPRLIDLGANPVSIAPAIKGVMAQRLVRRLCPDCSSVEVIHPEDLDLIGKKLNSLNEESKKLFNINESTQIAYPNPKGCKECNNLGYKGRIGVYELFEIDPEIEKLILEKPSIFDVLELAIKKGMIPMLQDGFIRVLEKTTSVEEVVRVVGT